MIWVDYARPQNLDEALRLLREAKGKGRVIAGGTDLILQMKRRVYAAELLVDITGIQELGTIEEEDSWVRIGAGVTHGQIAKNPLILREAPALAQGCGQMGSPQVRNMGTLVGNVVNAHAAGDGAIPLMALEAEIQVASGEEHRWIAMEEAYCGIGLSAVDATREVATGIRFKKPGPRSQTGFFRIARRKAVAMPIVNGAVILSLDGSGQRITKAGIAVGPVAYRPFRCRQAEAFLESREISDIHLLQAGRMASEEGHPLTTLQASDAYRKRMIEVHLWRTLKRMLDDLRKAK